MRTVKVLYNRVFAYCLKYLLFLTMWIVFLLNNQSQSVVQLWLFEGNIFWELKMSAGFRQIFKKILYIRINIKLLRYGILDCDETIHFSY